MPLYARFQQVVLLCTALALSGCGYSMFTSRETNPIVEDYLGGFISGQERVGFMGTTATHRLVTVRLNTGPTGVGRTGMLCPEPPPDVAQAVASSFAAALSGSVTQPEGLTAEAQGAIARSFATAVMPLLQRSQGLELYRDGMYYLCIAHMNEIIDEEEFEAMANDLLGRVVPLIAAEIRGEIRALEARAAQPPQSPSSVDDIVRILSVVPLRQRDESDGDGENEE
ncbi:MAG: hypothetical protein H6843_07790 [Rhodospirillaceae bacterium]|nr:hypothetical protein [Rhodospirillaceae bacterium]